MSVMRIAIINLVQKLLETDKKDLALLISSFSFKSEKELKDFVYSLKELLMTWFSETIKEDVTLIITDCKKG